MTTREIAARQLARAEWLRANTPSGVEVDVDYEYECECEAPCECEAKHLSNPRIYKVTQDHSCEPVVGFGDELSRYLVVTTGGNETYCHMDDTLDGVARTIVGELNGEYPWITYCVLDLDAQREVEFEYTVTFPGAHNVDA